MRLVSRNYEDYTLHVRIKSSFIQSHRCHIIITFMLWQIRHLKAAWEVILMTRGAPEQITRSRCATVGDGWVVRVCRCLGRVEGILRYASVERRLCKRGTGKTFEDRVSPLAIARGRFHRRSEILVPSR